jgi:hypothetical protein
MPTSAEQRDGGGYGHGFIGLCTTNEGVCCCNILYYKLYKKAGFPPKTNLS